ncbi:MAG: tetratricopeptide repeat protein [Deinococcota bacterium]
MKRVWAVLLGLSWVCAALAWAQAGLGPQQYHQQCQALYAQGDLNSARATCELALVTDPEYLPSLKLLTRIYLERKDLAAAKPTLEKLDRLAPNDPEVQLLTGWARLLEGRPADALVFLGNQGSTQALILRGQALEALGRYEEALPLYLRATANAEGRLGAARLYQRMGRLQEGITLLGDSPAESVLRTELQWAAGQLGEAAAGLEATLPRLGPLEPDYNRALGLLAMIYYGQGDWTKGGWVLRQLSARVGLANELFLRTWPWLLTFLIFLGIVLYGESRIEPMRTIEMSGEPIYGPGTLYVWLTGGLVLAAIVSGWVGFSLYGNWLAIFTPVQSELVRPVFYFLLGAFVLMITYNRLRRHLAIHLGLPRGWIEGLWAGVVLLALLGLYSLVRKPLGLGEVPPMFLTFVGFALLEPVLRGVATDALRERYKELALPMAPLLGALAVPGPTLFLVAAGFFLGWLRGRAGGVWGGVTAWVLVGIILALIANLPLVRTLL